MHPYFLKTENDRLRKALRDLVDRCDGEEGVRADGSNISTFDAHVALGDIVPLLDEVIPVDEIKHRIAIQNTVINELMRGRD